MRAQPQPNRTTAPAALAGDVLDVGDRHILRYDGRWFPRRGNVEVNIGQAITPTGAGFEAALVLKNATRAVILAHVNEPDIAAETPRF